MCVCVGGLFLQIEVEGEKDDWRFMKPSKFNVSFQGRKEEKTSEIHISSAVGIRACASEKKNLAISLQR